MRPFFSEHSTVFKIGTDLKVYDWKTLVETYFKKKTTLHTRITKQNVLFSPDLNDEMY